MHLVLRHNICCALIEIYFVDFDQPQTCHYEQKNKRSGEILSIVDNEREENCKVENTFRNNQIAEPLTNNVINMHTMVLGQHNVTLAMMSISSSQVFKTYYDLGEMLCTRLLCNIVEY